MGKGLVSSWVVASVACGMAVSFCPGFEVFIGETVHQPQRGEKRESHTEKAGRLYEVI